MKFQPKHVVTMVVALSAAVILAPVGVLAATGQLVNITDPSNSARKARVSSDGSLRVESRAGASSKTFSFQSNAMNNITFFPLKEFAGSDKTALTEMSFAAGGIFSDPDLSYTVHVWGLVRTSGSAACALSAAGWTKKLMRTIAVRTQSSVTLTFTGSPLLMPSAAADQRTCLGVELRNSITDGAVYVGGTGYRFTS